MYRSILIVSLLFVFFGLKAQNSEVFSETRIIVQLEQHVDAVSFFDNTIKLNGAFTYRGLRSKRKTAIYFLDFDAPQDILNLMQRLEEYKEIVHVEPDYIGNGGGQMMIEPNDPLYALRQYGLENSGDFPLSNAVADADIDMSEAWEYSTGCSNIVVAVLDSGVKFDHPELDDNVWINEDEINDLLDTDNNGYVNDNVGWDFVNEDNNPVDDQGHGTNVSGILSGEGDNSLGYAGVNWNSPLMTLKVLNNLNSGFYSWWTEAIYYAVDNGASVINMSLGGGSYSSFMEEAVNYAYANDVAVVACMMNFNNEVTYYPSGFANSISVGATDAEDNRVDPFFWSNSSGSNYGTHIDIVAPGNYIYGLSHTSNTNYNSYWGGTSQSTPLVAGVASLMYCMTGEYEGVVDDIRTTLRETAEDQVGMESEDTPGFDKFYGWGRMNAADALLAWLETVNVKEESAYNIDINPNPSSDIISISWDMPEVNSIVIYSINGQKVYSMPISTENSLIVEGLNPGIYIVKINSLSESTSKKLVIQ